MHVIYAVVEQIISWANTIYSFIFNIDFQKGS